MYIITLHVEGVATPYGLRYRHIEKAKDIFAGLIALKDHNPPAREGGEPVPIMADVADDYGQTVSVARRHVTVVQFIDIKRDLEAQGDLAILQTREQSKLNARAASDPMTNLAQSVAQGGKLIRPS